MSLALDVSLEVRYVSFSVSRSIWDGGEALAHKVRCGGCVRTHDARGRFIDLLIYPCSHDRLHDWLRISPHSAFVSSLSVSRSLA